MILWAWAGRAVAILIGLGVIAAVIFWPVFIWGWNGWSGLYVGLTIGRFLMFEASDPTLWRRRGQAVPDDVR